MAIHVKAHRRGKSIVKSYIRSEVTRQLFGNRGNMTKMNSSQKSELRALTAKVERGKKLLGGPTRTKSNNINRMVSRSARNMIKRLKTTMKY